MRAIVGRIGKALSDPGSVVSVIAGLLVGALLGGHYEPRTPAHTVPDRGPHPGEGDD
jgi:hypothetical protein